MTSPIGSETAGPAAPAQLPGHPSALSWLALIAVLVVVALLAHRRLRRPGWSGAPGRGVGAGLAGSREVARAAGRQALLSRASTLRTSLPLVRPNDVGYRIGKAHRIECWASVEDSVLVLGPPRAGKGMHLVIPLILDAPGPVITTSTRPDNLAVTLHARSAVGACAVFDPQGLAPGLEGTIRWSPTRGCHKPSVAMARAQVLCASAASGVEDASFWNQQARTVTRCLLHAAALDQRPPAELLRWSLSALAAQDAADILATHPAAAPTWGSALDAVLTAEPRQRDSTWATVANVFAPLADPAVLAAVSPEPGQCFDPARFLGGRDTLYLLGTASGSVATATLVAALVEDVLDTARRGAAVSPGARLDPPLALILDEAANYPLPSLPALMSEGGGSGISTTVVIQSLSQARSRWGRDEAASIWETAIVKIILGGSANAEDLRDLSALLGTREDKTVTVSRDADGRRSTSTSVRDVPILDPTRLRTLAFGTAVLLLRAAPPIGLTLHPWTTRPDAEALRAGRDDVEAALRVAAMSGAVQT